MNELLTINKLRYAQKVSSEKLGENMNIILLHPDDYDRFMKSILQQGKPYLYMYGFYVAPSNAVKEDQFGAMNLPEFDLTVFNNLTPILHD